MSTVGGIEPQIFFPIEEEPPPALTFTVRGKSMSNHLLERCRETTRSVDREVPVYDVKMLDERVRDELARPRFYSTATSFLAFVAAVLAAVGIYGTAANSIAQRTRELGIRIAVGASSSQVRIMLLRESALPIVAGALAGMFGSLFAIRWTQHLIENAASTGISNIALVAGSLILSGMAAAWIASAKVLSVDPADAMRAE